MGWRKQGTTVHCAIGINVFRQICGRKKWYFMHPNQSPYVYPRLYSNAYSATSKTVQNHHHGQGTPWFNKIERYTVTLNPGDVLINPPWWWHCVENLNDGHADNLVIGVPTRFDSPKRALRLDPFKTLLAAAKYHFGNNTFGAALDPGDEAIAFEKSLIENREETYQQLILQ